MHSISHSEFIEKMKHAVMICSPEYGYYINAEKKSPYYKNPMVVPEDVQTFCLDTDFGTALKLIKGEDIIFCAFIF